MVHSLPWVDLAAEADMLDINKLEMQEPFYFISDVALHISWSTSRGATSVTAATHKNLLKWRDSRLYKQSGHITHVASAFTNVHTWLETILIPATACNLHWRCFFSTNQAFSKLHCVVVVVYTVWCQFFEEHNFCGFHGWFFNRENCATRNFLG